MKILYIHQFFRSPEEGGSIRSYYLAKELVRAGHDVTIISSHTQKSRKETLDGIKLRYVHVNYDNSYPFYERMYAFLKFLILACWESIKINKVDLCYVMTTPLTTGFVALWNKYILRRPYIFEVGDLWPLVPIEMRIIESKIFAKTAYFFEKWFYCAAKGLIGLSPPISNYMSKLAPKVPIATVYNIAECEFFRPNNTNKTAKNGEFQICYTGTFGMANDLIRIVKIAKEIQQLPIHFTLVGTGAEKHKVEDYVSEHKITNVTLLDHQLKQAMVSIINRSDAMLISFANHESLFTGSPNKLFDGLAGGKIIITNFEGWIGELITKHECGFSFVHNSSDDFVKKISPLLNNEVIINQWKSNARNLGVKKFDLSIQSKIQQEFIDEMID